MTGPRLLSANEITDHLRRALPHWRLEGGALRRRYRVNGFRSALLAANAIGHLAEAAWHHPELTLSWGKVEVSLWTHDAGGVTDRDLALADKIEEVVAWRPDTDAALEGNPGGAVAHLLPD